MNQFERNIENYLWYCGQVRGMSAATMNQKRNVLERFAKSTGIKNLADLTNDVVNTWLAHESERGVMASSLNAYISIVATMLRHFREQGVNFPLNFNLLPRLKSARTQRIYYTAEEVAHVVALTDFRTGLMIQIMFETGMRIAELTHLKLLDFDGRKIRFVGKGCKTREVYLRPETLTEVQRYIALYRIRNYLWGIYDDKHKLSGEPPTTATVRNRLRRAFEAAGFKGFHPHALRHSFATNLQRRGASVTEIKEMIGHSSIATTERYLHGLDGRLEELFDKYC